MSSPVFSRGWICIDDGPNSGKFNMNFDLALVDRFIEDKTPFLRFYSWKPYCISIGRNQAEKDINITKAAGDGIDVVRRPTGGKAVLHAEELTYSVVMGTYGLSVRETYNIISEALASGLRRISRGLELSRSSADFRKLFNDPSTIPCFSTSAVFEVEWQGKKLVGSAQHRFGEVLLQHGSILIGDFHKKIVDYMNCSEETRSRSIAHINAHTVSLSEIAGEKIDTEEVARNVKLGFEDVFRMKIVPQAATGERVVLSEKPAGTNRKTGLLEGVHND